MKAVASLIAFIIFVFYLPVLQPVLAVSVSITNFPATISTDPFTITVSVSGAASGTNYLRVDLYKDGTQNYFGETFNGSDWYSGSDGKQYLPITVQSGNTYTGDVQARFAVSGPADYQGIGDYKMRIRRYTSSGNPGSEDASLSSVSVNIIVPTPTITPTPVPSPTLSDTPAPIKTPTSTTKPSNTPTPIPLKTLTPTINPSITLINTQIPSIVSSNSSSQVLGIQSDTPTTAINKNIKIESASTSNIIGKVFIIFGLIFLILCGIVIIWPYREEIMQKIRRDN